MERQQTTSNPENQTSVPQVEYAFLDDNVDGLRVEQRAVYADDQLNDAEKLAKVELLIDQYLERYGVTEDSDGRDDYRIAIRGFAVDKISDAKWQFGDWNGTTHKNEGDTGHDLLHDKQEELFGKRLFKTKLDQDAQTADTADQDRAARLETMRLSASEAREKWATESSKRQGRIARFKTKERNKVETDYHATIRELGILELEAEITDEDDDTQKNAKVITWLFEEQKKLRELTTEKLNGTTTGKFLNWFNKENEADSKLKKRLKKFGKSAVVAAAAAGAAGLITIGAGGVLTAGAIGGATAGAIGFGRFVRGYGNADRSRGMKSAEDALKNGDDMVVEIDNEGDSAIGQRLDDATKKYNDSFTEDTQKEQVKRRKAFAWGAGAVAVGSTVGLLADHLFFDDVEAKQPGSGTDTPTIDTETGDAPGVTEGTPVNDLDKDGIRDGMDPDIDGDGVNNAADAAPRDPTITDAVPEETQVKSVDTFLESVDHDARWVEPNEGWYQTFQELGVGQEHWESLLEKAGPELQEQGWSYWDETNSEWRISNPGRLDTKALTTIYKAAGRGQDGFDLAA